MSGLCGAPAGRVARPAARIPGCPLTPEQAVRIAGRTVWPSAKVGLMAAAHVSPYGGSWYPGRRSELERLLDELFQSSEQRTGPHLFARPLGFVVPHAGLQYSGGVAASAYRHIRRHQPRRAVILGFTHRGGPAGVSIPNIDGYETPLGRVSIDRTAMERLAGHSPFAFVAESRVCDHSVEIQLPLLQRAAPDAQVVPLFVGALDAPDRDAAAKILASLCEPE